MVLYVGIRCSIRYTSFIFIFYKLFILIHQFKLLKYSYHQILHFHLTHYHRHIILNTQSYITQKLIVRILIYIHQNSQNNICGLIKCEKEGGESFYFKNRSLYCHKIMLK